MKANAPMETDGRAALTERELDTIGLAMSVIMANPSDERRFDGLWLIEELERHGMRVVRLDAAGSPDAGQRSALTERERRILRRVADYLDNDDEIAVLRRLAADAP